MVLSLSSLYREELQIIAAVKRRYPHVEVWLTQTEGRAAAMAEAMRLGADGLLLEDGFHRAAVSSPSPDTSMPQRSTIAQPPASPASASRPSTAPVSVPRPPAYVNAPALVGDASMLEFGDHDDATGEPILSAEELRALLQDPPTMDFTDEEN